jgi:hypothetical protein
MAESRAELEPIAERMYREATARFVRLTNDALERLAKAAELDVTPFADEVGFRAPSHVYFTELMSLTSASLLDWIGDRVLPRAIITRSATAQATAYLERILQANSSRLANDLKERVAESRRVLEREIRGRLEQVTAVAETALQRAERVQTQGNDAVVTEIEKLDGARAALSNLRRHS